MHALAVVDTDVVVSGLLTADGASPAGAAVDPAAATAGLPPAAPDPGDAHLWALLARAPGSVLITGDALLPANPPPGAAVATPRAFVDALTPSARG